MDENGVTGRIELEPKSIVDSLNGNRFMFSIVAIVSNESDNSIRDVVLNWRIDNKGIRTVTKDVIVSGDEMSFVLPDRFLNQLDPGLGSRMYSTEESAREAFQSGAKRLGLIFKFTDIGRRVWQRNLDGSLIGVNTASNVGGTTGAPEIENE